MNKAQAQLCRRLGQLQAQMTPQQIHSTVFIWHWIPKERRENLAPGERIVLDHYRRSGCAISALQRITTDPNDQGRRCEPGGYIEDIIQRLHQACPLRETHGSCRTCEGTPAAHT